MSQTVGDGEKLLTHLNSALKVLLGLDIFPRVPKKKLNFVDQCYSSQRRQLYIQGSFCAFGRFVCYKRKIGVCPVKQVGVYGV